jgi:hypothetical protein
MAAKDRSAAWVLGDPALAGMRVLASVRIEEEARTDPRFTILGEKIGANRFDALGRMVEVWAYCTEKQTYFVRADMLDAVSGVKNFGNFLVESDLASLLEEEDSCGFRIKGTKGRIEWLSKLRKNGKKGGRPRKSKHKPDGYPDGNQTLTRIEPPSNPLTLAPAPVLAPVISNPPSGELAGATSLVESEKSITPNIGGKGYSPEVRESARRFCGAYVSAYQTKFPGQRPADLWDGAVKGQILALIKGGFPVDRLSQLVQVYFQLDDKWFKQRGYSFATFRSNLNLIDQALSSGADPSGVDWGKVFAGGAS